MCNVCAAMGYLMSLSRYLEAWVPHPRMRSGVAHLGQPKRMRLMLDSCRTFYQTGYKSACHCHVLPVKNLMLSGKKSWRFWAPGTVAKLSQ